MSMSATQMAKLYNEVALALQSAKPSLAEVRRVFALMNRKADQLETAGHKAEAKAMRAEAAALLSSSVVRSGSTVRVRPAATVRNNMTQSAKAIKAFEKRLLRVERDVRHVVKGRSAHFDPRTGAMTRTPWPSYDEHVQTTERHDLELYEIREALGQEVQADGTTSYKNISKKPPLSFNWVVALAVFIAFTATGWALGIMFLTLSIIAFGPTTGVTMGAIVGFCLGIILGFAVPARR